MKLFDRILEQFGLETIKSKLSTIPRTEREVKLLKQLKQQDNIYFVVLSVLILIISVFAVYIVQTSNDQADNTRWNVYFSGYNCTLPNNTTIVEANFFVNGTSKTIAEKVKSGMVDIFNTCNQTKLNITENYDYRVNQSV